jgi:transcriptional regulator with XRE-family HTH domain
MITKPVQPQARRHVSHINAQWFDDALRDAGTSQAKLAGHLGISPSQVSKLMKGVRPVQLDEVPVIATFLGKTNAEVLVNLGIRLEDGGNTSSRSVSSGRSVPLVGQVSADGTATIDLEHPIRSIDAPGRFPPGTVAISGAGPQHSASSLIIGGMFFVTITDRLDPAAVGRLSLVRLSRGPWMLRTIKPSIEVGKYDLVGPSGVLEGQDVIAGSPVLLIRP